MWSYIKKLAREEAERETATKENVELMETKGKIKELEQQIKSQEKTIITQEAIIRSYQAKRTREDIRGLGVEGIEAAIEQAKKDLVDLSGVDSRYRSARIMSYGSHRLDETPTLLKALMQDTEDYIENLTREKYRIILQEEEN